MISVVIFFSIVPTVIISAPTKLCPGALPEGEIAEKGRYWYICREGKLEMKGCLSDKRKRLTAHESYKADGFVIECVPDNDEYRFSYKGCLTETNEEVSPNESWQDNNYWYICKLIGNQLRAEVNGCVDNGRRYEVSSLYLIYQSKVRF